MDRIPVKLYVIHESSNTWRKVYKLLSDTLKETQSPYKEELNKRDLLISYNLPPESWIDLKIIEIWLKKHIPIPLVSIFNYLLTYQKADGGIYLDNKFPHSGSTYRFVELATLLGFHDKEEVKKAIHFLINSLQNGGLPSPGPVGGAILEVGTTARFVHILKSYLESAEGISETEKEVHLKAIDQMLDFLKRRLFSEGNRCAWHTDREPSELTFIDECIVGATSLALYSIAKVRGVEEKELIEKVCRWLVDVQNEDGGWSERVGGISNIDNTFNAVRALKTSLPFLDSNKDIKGKVERALDKAEKYIYSINPENLNIVSLNAMLIRSILAINESGFIRDKFFLHSLEVLLKRKGRWYTKKAHIYNELLIVAIALAETIKKLKEKGKVKDFIKYLAEESKNVKEFLFDFPVDIPPFYPGYRDSLWEKFLNSLAKTSISPKFIDILSESITIKDIYSLFLSIFIFFTLIANDDFLKSIILPKVIDQNLHKFDIISTLFIGIIYTSWLVMKYKFRASTVHFISTTVLSIISAHILCVYWLKYSFDIVEKYVNFINTPYIRLLLSIALVLDLGKRFLDISRINRLFFYEDER